MRLEARTRVPYGIRNCQPLRLDSCLSHGLAWCSGVLKTRYESHIRKLGCRAFPSYRFTVHDYRIVNVLHKLPVSNRIYRFLVFVLGWQASCSTSQKIQHTHTRRETRTTPNYLSRHPICLKPFDMVQGRHIPCSILMPPISSSCLLCICCSRASEQVFRPGFDAGFSAQFCEQHEPANH